MPASHAHHWDLDPEVHFLNHGSFGACPRPVLERQRELQALLERQPVRFFLREHGPRTAEVREVLGAFVGADPDDLALIPNATTGVNTVLRSLDPGPGDELLVTDHEYNACRNALDFVARRSGARVTVARIPFPLDDPGRIVADLAAAVTPRTRLLLVDHVTSPTGMILPVAGIVAAMAERGVDVLVDGAHAPGMLPLDLDALGAAYYTGNAHKWLCTPKGAAFLHVRRDRQEAIHPLTISHGANAPVDDAGRFRAEADWTGTHDPTAALCIPAAIDFLRGLLPGGFPALRDHNRGLVIAGRRALCRALDLPPPCPESMLGSLAAVPLPGGLDPASTPDTDPLYLELCTAGFEVPVIPWPALGRRLLRISGQAYNTVGQYEHLAAWLGERVAG